MRGYQEEGHVLPRGGPQGCLQKGSPEADPHTRGGRGARQPVRLHPSEREERLQCLLPWDKETKPRSEVRLSILTPL